MDQTLESLKLKRIDLKGNRRSLIFSCRNWTSRPALLQIHEMNGLFSKGVLLGANEEVEFEVTPSASLEEKIKRENCLGLRASLSVGGASSEGKVLKFPLFWGKKSFSLVKWRVKEKDFSFRLKNLSGQELKGHVFVLEEGEAGPEVTWNWPGVSFPAGEERKFEGLLKKAGNRLKVVVLCDGKPPESFSIPPGRIAFADKSD